MKGKKYLIGQLGCYGDCLYATTIAKQLKHNNPDCRVTWAISPKYKSILNLNPHIDDIWIVENKTNDLYNEGWREFEQEAVKRKERGVYDELILSQIPNSNWNRFNGTIRSSILSAYNGKITVDVAPVIKLSDEEVENVREFANKYGIKKYKNVVLFECTPGSGQSEMNFETALDIAKQVTMDNQDTCFILSTLSELAEINPQIISARELSFRENAELTKYCTLLIGCSSGLTWLATSDWAKRLPTIQVLSKTYTLFAGVRYDFKKWSMANDNIVELLSPEKNKIVNSIISFINKGIKETVKQFNEDYKPSMGAFMSVSEYLRNNQHMGIIGLLKFSYKFYKNNLHLNILKLMAFPILKKIKNK
ncbi:MAG: glycosyltransferase family 9 protein [Niabella sp.]